MNQIWIFKFSVKTKISVHNNNLLHLYSSCSMCHPGTSCFALPLGCILSEKLSSLAIIPSPNKQEISNCFESNPELGHTDSEKRKNKLHQKKCKTLKNKIKSSILLPIIVPTIIAVPPAKPRRFFMWTAFELLLSDCTSVLLLLLRSTSFCIM